MADTAHQLFAPDPDAMLEHVEHLFGGFLGGCHDGLVELAWTDATPPNALRHARLYETDRLEELVAEAARLNTQYGCNVYIGAALRKPETAPFGRASDADFFALTCGYADLDEPGAATAAKDKYGTAKPTRVVVTGTSPHPRAQLWWRLKEPITDPALSEGLLKGVAAALSGDPTVVNPSRVMRLGGSVAWPVKDGRVTEATELMTPTNPTQAAYFWEQLARLFPAPEVPAIDTGGIQIPGTDGVVRATTPLGFKGPVVNGRETYMLQTLTACLVQLLAETGKTPSAQELFNLAWGQFSNPALNDINRLRANGQPWTPEAFADKVNHTLKRFAEGKIRGARTPEEAIARHAEKQAGRKAAGIFSGPAQRPAGGLHLGPVPVAPKCTVLTAAEFVAGFTPPAYLIDGMLQRGYLYSLTARTGHGKTAVAMYIGQCVARGQDMHGRTVKGGTVLLLAGENPDDIRARYLVLAEAYGFKAEDLKMRFVAGVVNIEASMPEIRAAADAIPDLMLVMVDTAAAYFPGDETNSNSQQGAYARQLRQLTFLNGKPTVLVNCHPVKNAARDNLLPMGGSAFLNEVDGNLTLWSDGEGRVTLHWQGKFRGPEFNPSSFELAGAESARVVDAEGRLMPSVVAKPISEMRVEAAEAIMEQDENQLLRLIHRNPRSSFADLGIKMGAASGGKPLNKRRIQTIVDRLRDDKLAVKHRGGKYRLTAKGREEIGVSDDENE